MVAVVALAGCAAAPQVRPASAADTPVPLPQPVEPAVIDEPKPLPIDAAPLDVAEVPGCEGGCELRFDIALPDGGRIAGVQGVDAQGFPSGRLVRRAADGEVRVAEPVEDAYVTGATACDAERCAVVFEVGAHGVDAVLVDADDLTVTGTADAGTPGARPIDLDGDDRVDLALQQSTGEPSYAAAPRFWQTWLQTPDGALEPAGCGPLEGEEPTGPQTGPCPPA